jgi:hypothetical protein
MGSRGNICVVQSEGEVWFYTHWSGHRIEQIVADALDRGRDRWNDETYLARIIFCELVGEDNLMDNTGFGIGLSECDPNYPSVYVNVAGRTVECDGNELSFDQFVARYETVAPPRMT